MKRIWLILFVTLVLAGTGLLGQQSGNKSPSSQPSAKRPPQAKTQAEFKDYNVAYAVAGGSAVEKAADDFAAKYPNSELKVYLYSKALHEYQTENNPGKMLAMADKVLALDPDNPIALVLKATVMSDSLNNSDQDREQKVAQIKKDSKHALETVETGFAAPPNATPEQIAAYKSTLQSMAYSALGIMELKMDQYASAEKDLRAAADLGKAQPDPYIWYHLALAQDRQGTASANPEEQQKKYSDALVSVRQALLYTSSNPDLGKLAEGEQKRLLQLTGLPSGTTAPQTSPTPPL